MSILDIKQQSQKWQNVKIILVYLAVSIFCIIVDKIYATFGHGVTSNAMTWMFLYPLIGGILFFLLRGNAINRISKHKGYRSFCNIFNSGIAILTVGSFLKGVMDIAGTSSKYVIFYYLSGVVCIICSLVLRMIQKYSKSNVVA